VLALLGCGAPVPASSGDPVATPTAAATPTSAPAATRPTSPTPAGATSPTDPPCRVDLPAAWSAALEEGVVPAAPGQTLTVVLGADDGTTFLVTEPAAGRRGRHALEWRRGEAHGVVQDFGADHPEWQVLGATWDGRHLAYRVDRSYSGFEDFDLYVWDSQGKARPERVARGEPDRHGDLMQTPFVDPVLADGWLYWTQTRDADPGRTVLSGYRLDDGRTERLSRGYGRAPVRFGDALVWADSDDPGQPSSLRMLDLTTHRRVPLPAALAGVRGPSYLAGDADTLAWVGGTKGRQLLVWRAGWARPHLLVDRLDGAQFPRVAGEVVVLAGDDAVYAADLRSSSYARVTPAYGGIYADGGPVVAVGFAPTDQGGSSVQALLDTDAVGPLGRAGC
jgi:hypothetical protein